MNSTNTRKRRALRDIATAALFAASVAVVNLTLAQVGADPGRVAGAQVTITGVVTTIDRAQRVVVMRSEEGREVSFRVDPTVQGVERLQEGDRVQLDYLVGVALELKKGGGELRQNIQEDTRVAGAPGLPGQATGRRTTMVADVLSVDPETHVVRLRGAEGRTLEVEPRDPQRVAGIKPGDQVVAVIDEALALRILPAPADATH